MASRMEHQTVSFRHPVVYVLGCLVLATALTSRPAAAIEQCAPWRGIPGCLHDFVELEDLTGRIVLNVSAAEAEGRVEYQLSEFVLVSMPNEYNLIPEKIEVRASFDGITRWSSGAVCETHGRGSHVIRVSVAEAVRDTPTKKMEHGLFQGHFMSTLLDRLPILIRSHPLEFYTREGERAFREQESRDIVTRFGPTRTPGDIVDFNIRARAWQYERDKGLAGILRVSASSPDTNDHPSLGFSPRNFGLGPRPFPTTTTCRDGDDVRTTEGNLEWDLRFGHGPKGPNVVGIGEGYMRFNHRSPAVETGEPLNSPLSPFSRTFEAETEQGAPHGRVKGTLLYTIGEGPPFHATLEPVDPDETGWLPDTIGEKREFKMTLSEETLESVQAVRFRLSDVSQHPGIAINAGVLKNSRLKTAGVVGPVNCPDSVRPSTLERWSRRGEFCGSEAFVRYYTGDGICPIDELPDVFFRDVDNPAFDDMGPDAISDEYDLLYVLTHEIAMHDVKDGEVVASVVIKDHAASARLSAEFMIGGAWLSAVPVGDTAVGDHLMIPRDLDGDDVADAWEETHKDRRVEDPGEDLDTHDSAGFVGDGLTAFEEYRGAYLEDVYTRLNPRRKTVFVHDYYHPTFLKNGFPFAKGIFSSSGLDLVMIQADEFRDEIVNTYGSEHHAVDQYAVVLMDVVRAREDWFFQVPGAWEVCGRPDTRWLGLAQQGGGLQAATNTVMVNTGMYPLDQTWKYDLASTLAHEIGHALGVQHPGDHDFVCEGKNGDLQVAVTGGQHSGMHDSVMRYEIAAKLFRRKGCGPINETQLRLYQRDRRRCEGLPQYNRVPVPGLHSFSLGPGGTGPNIGDQGAGDACRDGDLPQVNVRSPS